MLAAQTNCRIDCQIGCQIDYQIGMEQPCLSQRHLCRSGCEQPRRTAAIALHSGQNSMNFRQISLQFAAFNPIKLERID